MCTGSSQPDRTPALHDACLVVGGCASCLSITAGRGYLGERYGNSTGDKVLIPLVFSIIGVLGYCFCVVMLLCNQHWRKVRMPIIVGIALASSIIGGNFVKDASTLAMEVAPAGVISGIVVGMMVKH
jgi:hypothetical protein